LRAMRASFVFTATTAAFLFSCGGKVIFDTGSSAGGSTNTTGFGPTGSVVTSTHASAVTGTSVVSGVTSTGITTAAVTTGTGQSCVDKGAPSGSMVGTTDCGFMPCNTASKCVEVCSALYDCGLVTCGPGGAQLCPGAHADAAEHDAFIATMGGCAQACMQMPAIKQIIDPTDCITTIQTLEGVAPGFKAFCENAAGG